VLKLGCLQAILHPFERSGHLSENRGVPGSNPGLAIETRGLAMRSPSAATSASDAFDRAIGDFAESYADQNERDHAARLDAIASGARPGPRVAAKERADGRPGCAVASRHRGITRFE
jgi:hypothetical protein